MGQNLANASAALKDDYQPTMREQLNNSCMLLEQIEKGSEDVEGNFAVLSLHVSRNSGVGARREGGTLPTAGHQGTAEERVPLRYNYATIKLSGQVIKATKSNVGSFVRAVDFETKGAVKDLRRDVNRQLYGTSNGVIAACTTTTSSTTVVLATTTTEVQLRQLEESFLVDIGTDDTFSDIATARSVVSVDYDAKTIVISGAAVSTDSNDRVVRSGAGGAGSGTFQAELTGLQTIISDTGTVFNVNPSTYSVWKSSVFAGTAGANRPPTENLFAKVVQRSSIKGGVDIDLFITSDGVHRNYAAQLLAQKRFQNSLTLKGGYKAISITAGNGEVGLIWDRDAVAETAFGVSTPNLKQHEMSDWEWMDLDGAILARDPNGSDGYVATLYKYHEVTTDQRNAHAIVQDLTEA